MGGQLSGARVPPAGGGGEAAFGALVAGGGAIVGVEGKRAKGWGFGCGGHDWGGGEECEGQFRGQGLSWGEWVGRAVVACSPGNGVVW